MEAPGISRPFWAEGNYSSKPQNYVNSTCHLTRWTWTTLVHPAQNEGTYTNFVFLNLSSQCRCGRFVRGAVQHDAVPVLRLQRRLPLRQPQRQVLLALHQRPHPHDAGRKLCHQGVHLEVSSLSTYAEEFQL